MSDWAAGDAEGLSDELEERGYRGRIVSIQRLRDLQEEIEGGHRQGLFDEEFYREWLAPLTFSPADSLPDARSLIVAAVPQPQLRVTFNWNGEAASFFVPPTYLHGREADARVEGFLAEVLGRQGYRLSRARLPLKLLAVRSGLGAYGRNNICYVPGMGSFHRLAAFYSDFPCREDAWQEPQMMERCANCSACLNKCPSGAISSGRFLLHAERCIIAWSDVFTVKGFARRTRISWGGSKRRENSPRERLLFSWRESRSISSPPQRRGSWSSLT
jgi:epoxyqueuosine reductase